MRSLWGMFLNETVVIIPLTMPPRLFQKLHGYLFMTETRNHCSYGKEWETEAQRGSSSHTCYKAELCHCPLVCHCCLYGAWKVVSVQWILVYGYEVSMDHMGLQSLNIEACKWEFRLGRGQRVQCEHPGGFRDLTCFYDDWAECLRVLLLWADTMTKTTLIKDSI